MGLLKVHAKVGELIEMKAGAERIGVTVLKQNGTRTTIAIDAPTSWIVHRPETPGGPSDRPAVVPREVLAARLSRAIEKLENVQGLTPGQEGLLRSARAEVNAVCYSLQPKRLTGGAHEPV